MRHSKWGLLVNTCWTKQVGKQRSVWHSHVGIWITLINHGSEMTKNDNNWCDPLRNNLEPQCPGKSLSFLRSYYRVTCYGLLLSGALQRVSGTNPTLWDIPQVIPFSLASHHAVLCPQIKDESTNAVPFANVYSLHRSVRSLGGLFVGWNV